MSPPPGKPPEGEYEITLLLALITQIEDRISILVDKTTSNAFINKMEKMRKWMPSEINYLALKEFERLYKKLEGNWDNLQKNATPESIKLMNQACQELQLYLEKL